MLLSDPATVYAATDAFARAEQPENAAWPFVASVGLRTVTLRWAFGSAASVPEPQAPWRPGRDPRVWIADRDEIGVAGPPADPAAANAALAIGQFEETVVFINTSRAPGPIAVAGGADEDSVLLRELIARQARSLGAEWLQDGAANRGGDGERRGAWWPMEIEGDAIVLLGLAIARMFTADEARLACELMQRTATEERQRQTYVVGREVEAIEAPATATAPATQPEPAAVAAPTPETEYIDKWRRLGYVEEESEPATPENADLEDWLRQVKAAAAARVEPASTVGGAVSGREAAASVAASAGALAAAASVAASASPVAASATGGPASALSAAASGPATPVAPALPIVASSAAAPAVPAPTLPAVAPAVAVAAAQPATDAPSALPVEFPATAATPAHHNTAVPSPTSSAAPVPLPVASASSVLPAPSAAGSPARTPAPSPAPAEDDLDDWASGFAVSSADQTANR